MTKKRHKNSIITTLFNWTFTLFIALLLGFQVLDASANNLKFAQVSDAHYSSDEKNTSYKVLEYSGAILDDVISQINGASKVEFVLFTGDLVNKPKETQIIEFSEKANRLNSTWYPILGNHDVQEHIMPKEKFMEIVNKNNDSFDLAKPYYSFSPKKGYRVLCLDSIILDDMTTNGKISEEQLKWLDCELSNAKNDIVIIGLHVPVVEPYYGESHRLLNRNEVKQLLHKYEMPIIVCSGHYHGSKIIQEKNVLYIDSPSLVTYPCAFRFINIITQRNGVKISVYTKQTRLNNALNKAKIKVMGASFLIGTPEDRDNTFFIKF